LHYLFLYLETTRLKEIFYAQGSVGAWSKKSCPLIWVRVAGFQLFGLYVGLIVGSHVMKRKVMAILKPF